MQMRKQLKAPFAHEVQRQPGSDISRIIALSDCVIAVAFTLLVEEIRFPPADFNESQLLSYVLHSMLPDILIYFVSYVVVASSWISHDRIFSVMKRSNGMLVMLNVVFLASIVFLPVPVTLFYLYGNQTTVWVTYATTQLVTSAMLLLLWFEARREHLLDTGISAQYLTFTTLRLLVIPLAALISIGISFYSLVLAEGFFLLSYVLVWLIRGTYFRNHQTAGLGEGSTRICSITDNMVAVAITFLITKITGVVLADVHQSLSTTLNAILAQLLVYGFSLLIVGFYWLAHHHMFMYISRHNQVLIWLNFAFLLFIELQPLLNNLHATYPTSQVASGCYALGQALTGLMLLVLWLYAARKHRLIDQTLSTAQSISLAKRALLPPLIFLFSLGVIYFRNEATVYIWLLVLVLEAADLLYRRVRHNSP
jgi:uncharacterized membrane protein